MNYDKIAAMKVNELRPNVREILNNYNHITGNRITSKEISFMPKARLLTIFCRYWAELDAEQKYRKMAEELKHRATLMALKTQEEKYALDCPVCTHELYECEPSEGKNSPSVYSCDNHWCKIAFVNIYKEEDI